MRCLVLGSALLAVTLGAAPTARAAGDAQEGKWKAETCMGCHAVESYKNVYPTYHVPKLAGQHESYLVTALTEYRNGNRSHKTMQANVANLSDQDIADIAAYLASNPGR